MTKHTPGPWYVRGQSSGNYIAVHSRCGLQRQVARVNWAKIDDPVPCDAANANLIAAAPDLLAALQAAEGALDAILDRGDNPGIAAIRKLALAAIAKATE